MSKKTIFISITIFLIIFGSWNFGFFTRFNYLTAKNDIAKNKLQIVFVGESMLSIEDINKVSKKYGFKVINYGCIINRVEQNGIEIYNSKMDDYLGKLNSTNWKKNYEREIDSLMKLTNIPITAFWIENKEIGYWFNVDYMHSHKNKAKISIFNKNGELVTKGEFILVCPKNKIEFIDDLKIQIDHYDGKNIQLYNDCYLLKTK
ncbi:hypothetical protein ACFS5J_00260 [Flavobacterium chuncheonense]|uniref:Uncharacterized protein n=1 Tax=Flavobacterium chuncheonense TaxID=2026653 RepID=A0ABW5YHF2_9FLAO